ncbi:MAG: ABC transporter substrate-binding protein [Methylobacterium frigidaeris]
MRRRECLSFLGTLIFSRPTIASSQSRVMAWRVGIVTAYYPDDAEIQSRLDGFTRELRSLDAKNKTITNISLRSASGSSDLVKIYARETVEQRPDAILSATTSVTSAILKETKDIPIVFVSVSDPVGSGFVNNVSKPEKNVTGFVNTDPTLCVKWVEILKEVAPGISYIAIMYNPLTAPYSNFYIDPFVSTAHAFNLQPLVVPVSTEEDIAAAVSAVAQKGGGLILMNDSFVTNKRFLINNLIRHHKVPTMAYNRHITASGGLISYGVDEVDTYSRAAHYIYRILQGEKIAELPVQRPERINLAINMETARLLGLSFPESIFAQANEVFE